MLATLTGHLTSLIGDYGVYAVFALMAIDALLPAGGEPLLLLVVRDHFDQCILQTDDVAAS